MIPYHITTGRDILCRLHDYVILGQNFNNHIPGAQERSHNDDDADGSNEALAEGEVANIGP